MFDECYWARLSGLTGSFDDIEANGSGYGQFYLEVKEEDVAVEVNCEIVPLDGLEPPADNSPSELEPGTYIVNRDIAPGLYQGVAELGVTDQCYWARLSGVAGDFDSIVANGSHNGQYYLEVKDSDFALETRCALSELSSLQEPDPNELPTTLLPGIYIVGRDIAPGQYRGQAGEDVLDACYWARLGNVSGEFSGILANDSSNGQYFVEVF